MKTIIPIFLLVLVSVASAQFTKVYEVPISNNYKIPMGKVQISGVYDAEKINEIYPQYHAFRSGDEIKVLNLSTQDVEFSMDLTSLIDTTHYYTYVTLYKNLFKSDNSWSCFLIPYTTTSSFFDLEIYSYGKHTKTNIKQASIVPNLRSGDGKLFLIAQTNNSVEVYLVRNDMPQTSAIPYNTPYISALKKINDNQGSKLFNAIGQKIDDSFYGTLPDYLKKTYYRK